MEPNSAFLVPIPTQTLVSNSLGQAGQDARITKLPESPGPSCSPFIKSPCRKLRSGDQMVHVVPGTPPPFTMRDSNSPAMGDASLESRNSSPPQVRTKMRAQHMTAALSGSISSSSLKCVYWCPLCSIPRLTTLRRYKMHHTPLFLVPASRSSGLRHSSAHALGCQFPD